MIVNSAVVFSPVTGVCPFNYQFVGERNDHIWLGAIYFQIGADPNILRRFGGIALKCQKRIKQKWQRKTMRVSGRPVPFSLLSQSDNQTLVSTLLSKVSKSEPKDPLLPYIFSNLKLVVQKLHVISYKSFFKKSFTQFSFLKLCSSFTLNFLKL